MTTLIDLRQARKVSNSASLAGLRDGFAQLVGEPFRFARVSYGEELTLHFGDLRPARSPKLQDHLYGACILGVRGSSWILKSGSEPLMLTTEIHHSHMADLLGAPIRNHELEANPLIQPESRVLSAMPFAVKPANGIGLQLKFSDGSTLIILPTPSEIDESDGDSLPELADWELISPRGLLSAGPGQQWSFQPKAGAPS